MTKRYFLYAISALLLVLFLADCTTASVSDTADGSADLYFVSESLPDLSIPGEVGVRSENPANETGILRDSFYDAYMEAQLRGINLTGVLGGDRVNPWPADTAESWSQNWAGKEDSGFGNSWGIPNLVLAIGNYRALSTATESDYAPVFTVSGPVLDMYGKSAGYNRTNGVTGYGIPLGEVFFYRGTAVQRFSRGRMIIAREGNRFSFQQDTANALLGQLDQEEKDREFGGRDIRPGINGAFAHTWAYIFSEKDGASDGPIQRVVFSKPWILQTGGKEITVSGFYYKSYNKAQDVLILLDSEQLPRRVHHLSGPILSAILSHKRLSGLGTVRSFGNIAGTGLGKSLATGFAIYGPPLTDPLPKLSAGNQSGEISEALFLEAQRFARGWIVVKSAPPAPEPNPVSNEVPQVEDGAE